MVVRRWKVPSSWPKPEPGTVTMPVASSSCGGGEGWGRVAQGQVHQQGEAGR